jgi:hypothetical protein|tara:strand:- start:92 stop:310 length:219 start_codon:yes stop_codon:yes gene_type:complete
MIKKINVSVSGPGVSEEHLEHISESINNNLVSIFDINLRNKIKKAEALHLKILCYCNISAKNQTKQTIKYVI